MEQHSRMRKKGCGHLTHHRTAEASSCQTDGSPESCLYLRSPTHKRCTVVVEGEAQIAKSYMNSHIFGFTDEKQAASTTNKWPPPKKRTSPVVFCTGTSKCVSATTYVSYVRTRIDVILVCGCSFTYSQYVPEKPQVLQSIPADDPTHEHRHGHMRYGEQAPLTLHSLLRLRTNHRCNRPRLFTPSPDTMTRRAHGHCRYRIKSPSLALLHSRSFATAAVVGGPAIGPRHYDGGRYSLRVCLACSATWYCHHRVVHCLFLSLCVSPLIGAAFT